MECRNLVLKSISGGGLKSVSKYKVYVVVRGTGGKKLQMTPYLSGSSELTWNFPMNFTIDEAEGLRDGLHLVIKIMAVNWLIRKTLGKVRVSIKDLMEGITEEGKESERIRFLVENRKFAKTGASLTLSYEFGKKFLHIVEAPYTTSGSNLLLSNLQFEELLTAVADVSAQGCGCGGGGCGGGCGGCGG